MVAEFQSKFSPQTLNRLYLTGDVSVSAGGGRALAQHKEVGLNLNMEVGQNNKNEEINTVLICMRFCFYLHYVFT